MLKSWLRDDRDAYGSSWTTRRQDGSDARNDTLSTAPEHDPSACSVLVKRLGYDLDKLRLEGYPHIR